MKLSDLGFDTKTGYHDKNLTDMESRFLSVLWTDHVGPENRISAEALAAAFDHILVFGDEVSPEEQERLGRLYRRLYPKCLDKRKRDVRALQNHLLTRHDHIPILSAAGNYGGYWLANDEAEAKAFYETFRKRGLTGLVKASRGKRAALVDMMQQLSFEFEDFVDKTFPGPVVRRADAPAPIEVVDAFLEKMTADPEKFADGLRKIGKKYGSVLLPKDQVKALAAKAAELNSLVASLEV